MSLEIATPFEFKNLYNHHLQASLLNYHPSRPPWKFFIFIFQPCHILTVILLSSLPSLCSINSVVYTLYSFSSSIVFI